MIERIFDGDRARTLQEKEKSEIEKEVESKNKEEKSENSVEQKFFRVSDQILESDLRQFSACSVWKSPSSYKKRSPCLVSTVCVCVCVYVFLHARVCV